MQPRNVSITVTQLLENTTENTVITSFPGDPQRIGGTHQELAASTQQLYLTNEQILENSSENLSLRVRTIDNTDESVVSILNAARPRILDIDSLRRDLKLVENETNVEAALEYDQRLRVIVDSSILRIRDEAVSIRRDSSGLYSFSEGTIAGRREEIVSAINNAQESSLNSFRSLEISLPQIENWRSAFQISSNIFHGIPRRFFDVFLLLGEEFCNQILSLISEYVAGPLSELFLYQHLGNIIAPFFALFLGYPIISSLTIQEWLNLIRSGLIHTQLIFNVLNTRTTESLSIQQALSDVRERYDINSRELNIRRNSVRGFSWSRAFWDINLSLTTNLLRLGRTLSFWGSGFLTVGYGSYYGFPFIRRILVDRNLLLQNSSENVITALSDQQTSFFSFNAESLQILQNFFYDFATQFPRYFQF